MQDDATQPETRRPHAALNFPGRLLKAEKIARLLALRPHESQHPFRVLEVGCGSGVISQYFGNLLGGRGTVDAVDVVDQRVVKTGFQFLQVGDTELPFADGVFDAVISNHEHAGTKQTQLHHLREMARVLRDDGKGYLAVLSRWQIVEPHYQLAFLSWPPHGMRSAYLRWRGCVEFYDCEPLSMEGLEGLFQACELKYKNQFAKVVRAFAETERQERIGVQLVALAPASLLHALRTASPTHVYLFAKNQGVLVDA